VRRLLTQVTVVTVGVLVTFLTACSGEAPAARPTVVGTPANTGTETVVVTVGAAAPVRAEVADTAAERAFGLMDRDRLAPDAGMVFVFPRPSTASFYMFRTRVPLSIAFLEDGRVVSVAEMTPCASADAADCQRYAAGGPYTLAVEAPGGLFTSAGVRPGDPVRIDGNLPIAPN
jgi:uncharacterized membrane protein (UPF0127 family)